MNCIRLFISWKSLLIVAFALFVPLQAFPDSLNTPRSYPTATKLQDGRVLVVGGEDSDAQVLSSAELFDPAMGTFTLTGNMASPRIHHTATLLADGRVLIVGGADQSGTPLATIELYDPAAGTFSASAPLSHARYAHIAVVLNSGVILIAGGQGKSSILASAELFNPTGATVVATGSMTISRYASAAVLLPSGKVFVCGGVGGADGVAAGTRAEVYDPIVESWSSLGAMLSVSGEPGAVLLNNGQVFITGNKTSDLFDPNTNSFSAVPGKVPPRGTIREEPAVVRLDGGDVLVYGGAMRQMAEGFSSIQFRYNIATNTYTALEPSIPDANRASCPAVLLNNGCVLIVGGFNGNEALNTAILYNPTTNAFTVP